MPPSVSTSRPEASADKGPTKVGYTELKEVVKAGRNAVDGTLVFRGQVARLVDPGGWSNLQECEFKGSRVILEVHYPEDKAPLMRALPTHKPKDKCPRIEVKISGFAKDSGNPQATVVQIYGVQPDPAPKTLPAGIDFISMQDIFMRGPSAGGGVADLPVYFDQKEDKGGTTYYSLRGGDCAPHGTWEGHFWVGADEQNRRVLAAIPKKPQCQRVRVKLTTPPTAEQPNRWGADLIGVGKTLTMPEPPPSP